MSQLPWDIVYQFVDPNICWQVWKSLLLDALNRHAPICHKRIRNSSVPWINPQIKQLMRKRDYHKKQAIKHDSETQWAFYKAVRNKVNIECGKQNLSTFVIELRLVLK